MGKKDFQLKKIKLVDCIFGSLVSVALFEMYQNLVYIFKVFPCIIYAMLAFMQALQRYVTLNQSSFIRDTCVISGHKSPSRSLSHTLGGTNEYKNRQETCMHVHVPTET